MGDYTKYGKCGKCNKWIPRDEMLSINVDVYDYYNSKDKIPIRLCKVCHELLIKEFEKYRWSNELKYEAEIRANFNLAKNSDIEYDTSGHYINIVRDIMSRLADSVDNKSIDNCISRPCLDESDDSEAAMRRAGKNVDIRY